MTREQLTNLGRPTLISLVLATKRWPSTSPPPRLTNTMELVTFLVRCQDEGHCVITIDKEGQAVISEPAVATEQKESTKPQPAPRAPRKSKESEPREAVIPVESTVVDETDLVYETVTTEIDRTLAKLEEAVTTLQSEVMTAITALQENQRKLQKEVERITNICLHLYSVSDDPQPRTFFDKPFEEMAGLNEPNEGCEKNNPLSQENPCPQRKVPVVPKVPSSLKL